MPEKERPKKYVREYLRRRKVDPDDVPDAVIVVLNGFTQDELKQLNRLGAVLDKALQAEQVDEQLIIAMVH